MEICATLIGEFVITPILSFVVLLFQFVFWMCCWVIVGILRGVGALIGIVRK